MLIPTDRGAGRGTCTAILGCRWEKEDDHVYLWTWAFLFLRCVMRSHLGVGHSCQTQLRWVNRSVTLEIYRDELYLKRTWMSYTWNVHGLAAIPEMYTDELYLKYIQMSYTCNVHGWAALLCELCKMNSYRNTRWFHSQGGVSSRGKES